MTLTSLQLAIQNARESLNLKAQQEKGSYGKQVLDAVAEKTNSATGLVLNLEQTTAVDKVITGESFCLVGSAGTGKTTTTKAMVSALMESNKLPMLEKSTAKLRINSPGVALIAYTRRAVRNIARQMNPDFKSHCMTFHSLVEYEPEKVETLMPDGSVKISKPFLPQRRKGVATLPSNLRVIFIDEASMFSIDFMKILRNALPDNGNNVQFIYIGDICQLPPIYGDGILGMEMNRLATVELTQVYRQALESPIIKYALMIKDNALPPQFNALTKDFIEETPAGKVSFIPWKKKLDMEEAGMAINQKLRTWVETDFLNFDEDVVLCPWGKKFGTIEMNKSIATALAKKNNRDVFEIIAGYNKLYFSVGDKVLVGKMDAVVTKIARNLKYLGKPPQPHSPTMDYWGWGGSGSSMSDDTNMDDLLDAFADVMDDVTDRVAQASHAMTIKFIDSEQERTVIAAAEFNAMELAYAMSVHKSQGSEWKRVILISHESHSKMMLRELVYTAFTRASKELIVIMNPTMLRMAATRAKIKGNTLEEKKKWFLARLKEKGSMLDNNEDEE